MWHSPTRREGAVFRYLAMGSSLSQKNRTRSSVSRDVGADAAAAVAITLAAATTSIVLAPDAQGFLGAALAFLMGAISVSDLRHFTIPNVATALACLFGVAHSVVRDLPSIVEPLGHAALRTLVLAATFLTLREIHWRLRGREGIGLGDVKLAGVAGAWLDWSTIPLTLEVAALAALAGYVIARLLGGQPLRFTNRVPFGLFLAPAIWLGWLFELITSEVA
jgi:leader peptidase (prepilin peptidase) / N-methyltransferase